MCKVFVKLNQFVLVLKYVQKKYLSIVDLQSKSVGSTPMETDIKLF